jgi:HEAT repeat protein
MVSGLLEAARGTGVNTMPDAALVDAIAGAARPSPALLEPALRDPDPGVRWHAAAAYMQLGPAARGAAPALLAAMDDAVWEVRNAAGRALEDVAGAGDVPLLAEALGDPSVETRYHAARALARTGPAAAGAMDALLIGLRDDDWEVRLESARALGAAGSAAAAAAPVLRDLALGDADPQVRASAAFAIAVVGGAVADETLARAARDPSPEVRRAAREALAWRARGRR